MVKFMKHLLEEQRPTYHFSILPKAVEEAFSFSCSLDYEINNLQRTCSEEVDEGYDNFYVLYCIRCVKDNNPKFVKKYKDYLS